MANTFTKAGAPTAPIFTGSPKLALSRDEVRAAGLPVSDRTLRRLEKRKLLERVPGVRAVAFTAASVQRLLAAKTKPPAPAKGRHN